MLFRFAFILTAIAFLLSCNKTNVADPSSDDFVETEPQLLTAVTQTIKRRSNFNVSSPLGELETVVIGMTSRTHLSSRSLYQPFIFLDHLSSPAARKAAIK